MFLPDVKEQADGRLKKLGKGKREGVIYIIATDMQFCKV